MMKWVKFGSRTVWRVLEQILGILRKVWKSQNYLTNVPRLDHIVARLEEEYGAKVTGNIVPRWEASRGTMKQAPKRNLNFMKSSWHDERQRGTKEALQTWTPQHKWLIVARLMVNVPRWERFRIFSIKAKSSFRLWVRIFEGKNACFGAGTLEVCWETIKTNSWSTCM